MKITTGKTIAAAVLGSALLHAGVVLTPKAWLGHTMQPLSATSVLPPRYPRITQQGVTYAWLTPPPSPPSPPAPPSKLPQNTPPITTQAAPEPEIYDASRLTDTPEPVGEIPLGNLPPGVSSSGGVEMSLLVSSSGKVIDIHILHSSLDPQALALTIQAFRQAPFRPGTFNGNPVTSRIKIAVNLHQE